MNSDRPISRLISALVLLSAITGAMLLLFMLLALYTKAAIGQQRKSRGSNGQPGVARNAPLATRTEVVRVIEMNAQGLIYLPLDTEVKKTYTLQKRKRSVWIRQVQSPRELPFLGKIVGSNFPQPGSLVLITICEKCKDGQEALFSFAPLGDFSPYEIRLRTNN